MTYEIRFDEEAINFLNKLEKSVKARIFIKVISTKQNPFTFFQRMKGRKGYKLRVGNYRVIADIDKELELIKVTLIGHRKNVYKK